MGIVIGVFACFLLFLVILILPGFRIVTEFERGVIFRLGRCKGAKGPGLFYMIPLIDKMIKANLQVIAAPVASQGVITKDHVTVVVDAVAYFHVIDPTASVVNIRAWYTSSQLVAQTTLRSIIGRHELDQLLSERDKINSELSITLDTQTEPWGVKVHRVEIRDVGLPETMQRAMAKQAEAERERRAKIIAAEGELQASEKLSRAAAIMHNSPGSLQLRQLQSLVEISAEKNSTIIFPMPREVLEAVKAFTNNIEAGNPSSISN